MRVKVTKKMASVLAKEFKDYTIEYTEKSTRDYEWSVDIDSFNHENDYDFLKDRFKVIKVIYPADYYACNKYLTTNDLLKCFKKSDKTYNGFIAEVKNEIEC